MNAVFLGAVLVAFVVAGYRQIAEIPVAGTATPMDALGLAMIDAAKGSVTLAIGLVGVMALFLGLMKVAEAGGLLTIIARTVRPLRPGRVKTARFGAVNETLGCVAAHGSSTVHVHGSPTLRVSMRSAAR